MTGAYIAYKYSNSKKITTEAVPYTDKQLDAVRNQFDDGIEKIIEKHPGMRRPVVKSGVRGTRYFFEFEIQKKHFDAFEIVTHVKNIMKKRDIRIHHEEPFSNNEMMSYVIDYEVDSTTARGAKSKGSIYIRGVKGEPYDNFKFVVEKNTDFHDYDVEILLKAFEKIFKPKKTPPMGVGKAHDHPNQSDWSKKRARKAQDQNPFASQGEPEGEDDSPQGVLEQHG